MLKLCGWERAHDCFCVPPDLSAASQFLLKVFLTDAHLGPLSAGPWLPLTSVLEEVVNVLPRFLVPLAPVSSGRPMRGMAVFALHFGGGGSGGVNSVSHII